MLADVDICNMALAHVLVAETIEGLDDLTPAGKACNRFFPICRDILLQRYPWSFALVESTFALVGTSLFANWAYTYALPTDCLDIHGVVVDGYPYPTAGQSQPFEIAVYSGQRVLNTNLETPSIRYTSRTEDTALYPPDVCEALAALIASRICALLGKIEMQPTLMQLAENLMLAAAARDLNQGCRGPEPDSDLLLSRL